MGIKRHTSRPTGEADRHWGSDRRAGRGAAATRGAIVGSDPRALRPGPGTPNATVSRRGEGTTMPPLDVLLIFLVTVASLAAYLLWLLDAAPRIRKLLVWVTVVGVV